LPCLVVYVNRKIFAKQSDSQSNRMAERPPFYYRGPPLRWIDYARRSWQRLGNLTILCSLSDPGNGTTLEGLTSKYQGLITSLQDIPDELKERVINYVRSYRPNRYPKKDGSISRVELQDLYLSDERLPSRSGAITGDMGSAGYRHAVYVEIPAWAVRLWLLRANNYTLTDRGKALLGVRPVGLAAFRLFDAVNNPYMLVPGERYLFLYCILDADGDLIQKISPAFLSHEATLTRSEIGNLVADSLEKLLREKIRPSTGGQEMNIAERVTLTVKSVRLQKGSGMGPRESVATPRTEPLVDCGLIQRISSNSYTYQPTTFGRHFFSTLTNSVSIDEFLRTQLAYSIASPKGKTVDFPFVMQYIVRSYARLRSGLGYCSIREVAVLAVAMALNESSNYFELFDAEQAIAEAAHKYGKDVRFTKSRQGHIALVRIATRVIAEYRDERSS
jgi:hypothetical protein